LPLKNVTQFFSIAATAAAPVVGSGELAEVDADVGEGDDGAEGEAAEDVAADGEVAAELLLVSRS
jgi:hypothetical protein